MKDGMTDEEFSRKYESFEADAVDAYLANVSRSRRELREGIEFLIRERERLRDSELSALEAASARLLNQLAGLNQRKLLEELACFKDLLALQRRLLEKDEKR
jgi:hypothetical protein